MFTYHKKMMKKLYLIILIAVISTMSVSAQDVFRGRVLSANEQPVARALVKIFDENENLLDSLFTDQQGNFITDISIEGIPGVTSNKHLLTEEYYLSYVYPNPAKKAPIHFKFRSKDGELPEITFYTFEGKVIREGAMLSPGTYIYRAQYKENPEVNRTSGLFSITQSMPLEVELISLQQANSSTPEVENANSQRTVSLLKAKGKLRVEVTKDEFITLSEEVDTDIPANIDREYTLALAPKPTADFEIIADLGTKEGDIVKFDASSSVGANNEQLKFFWDFGDQSKGGQPKIPHIYVQQGSYEVSLTVTGAYGAKETISKTVNISAIDNPGTKVALRGIISDAAGNPMDSATVKIAFMDTTFYTNAIGEVVFDGFPSGFPVMIEVAKEGFVSEFYKMNVQQEARQAYFELSLIPREPAIVLDEVALGGSVVGKDGTKVTLPIEGLIHADGTIATGPVDIYITPVNISDDNVLGAFPGDFNGITFEGEAPLIMSYGTADLNFIQNGEKLQLAAGKSATIELPFYVENNEFGEPLEEGDEVPLWSYDEASGNWIVEGKGVVSASADSPTGLVLVGEVNHFSWWNCDVAPNPWFPEFEFTFPLDDEGDTLFSIPGDGFPYLSATPQGGAGPRSRRTSNNCCQPLPTPPGIDIHFVATAGNGLYRGETVAKGEAGANSVVVIDLQRVANYGIAAGEIAPDTIFTSAIEEEGNIDAYSFNQPIGKILLLSVQAASGSNLQGTLEIRDPDNLPLFKEAFSSNSSASYTMEVLKTGDYQVIIDGTANEPGAYDVNLSTYRSIELNTNTVDEIVVERQVKAYVFEVQKDQLINIASESDFSGTISLSLYNEEQELLTRKRGSYYVETGVIKAEEDGFLTVKLESEVSGVTGNFILGLSEIKAPTAFSVNGDGALTTLTGEVAIIGNRQYFSYNEAELGRRKYAIHTLDSLAATFNVLKPDTTPFYQRRAIASVNTTSLNEATRWSSTDVIQLQDRGDYVLELNPYRTIQRGSKLGKYELFVVKPNIAAIEVGEQISDSISSFFGRVNEFRQYTFEATEGQILNAAVASNITGRSYLRLLDPDTVQLKNNRATTYNETGVFTVEKIGTYVLELDGVDPATQGNFQMGLPSIEEPTPINPTIPYLKVDGEVAIIGDKQYFSFTDTINARLNLALKTPGKFAARLRLLRPGAQKFYEQSQIADIRTTNSNDETGNRWGILTRQTNLPLDGLYIVEIDPNSVEGLDTKTGNYEWMVLKPEETPISINSQIDDELLVFFDQVNEAKHYIFSGTEGQLINVAYTDAISGRNTLRLLDKDNGELASIRDGQQLGIRPLPYTGMYRIELEGVDRDNSQGSFTLGLTTAEPPVAIDFNAPFTTINGVVDIVGKHQYYAIPVDSLERFNFGVQASDSFRTTLGFRRPSTAPFYQRPVLRGAISTGVSGNVQTGPFSAAYGGELILEIDPNLTTSFSDGSYQLYVGQREIQAISLNTAVQGSISKDLGFFNPANRYKFTAPASNKVNVNFTWVNTLGRVYIRLFTLSGESIYDSRTYSTGTIMLPANGDYVLELEFIDDPDGNFTFTVNAE